MTQNAGHWQRRIYNVAWTSKCTLELFTRLEVHVKNILESGVVRLTKIKQFNGEG
jgi:hypothetical protein